MLQRVIIAYYGVMAYRYFVHNQIVLPDAEATIPLNDIAYAYGYGVYESVRVTKSRAVFLQDHLDRLQESAKIIGLEHGFETGEITDSINKLIEKNEVDSCNIKILLVGGQTAQDANLYIQCLNPHFPDRKFYKQGASTITVSYKRDFPHAKSLNMLPSYLAYRDARQAGAYDALLVNPSGEIVEGTRTNFFAMSQRRIYSPPESEILLGVTRDKVLKLARENGFKIQTKDLKLSEIQSYEQVFLTSTSAKIMPIRSIDDKTWTTPNQELKELMDLFDKFLSS